MAADVRPTQKEKTLLANCLKIISVWEGNTLYAHGDGAVGLIGFQFSWRKQLMTMMGLPTDTGDDAFNEAVKSDTKLAMKHQMELGVEVLQEIYDFSCTPRGLKTFTAVLNVLDIGVNNGRQNSFLTKAEHELGWAGKAPVNDERAFARKVADVRIQAIQHMFKQYPGLSVRYNWYMHRCDKWDILEEWPTIEIAPKNVKVTMIQ